jgi:hypothetical protein
VEEQEMLRAAVGRFRTVGYQVWKIYRLLSSARSATISVRA